MLQLRNWDRSLFVDTEHDVGAETALIVPNFANCRLWNLEYVAERCIILDTENKLCMVKECNGVLIGENVSAWHGANNVNGRPALR